jgi:phage terminase large subunit-like protein
MAKRWKPLFDGHECSLGYEVIDQIEEFMCHGEGDLQGRPAEVDDEMRDHIIECYRLDPITGRRLHNEAVLSRPKGRAKSEIAAWVATAEAFLRVRFDGWDADGQPVAKPVTSPLVKCLATEEGQAGNTFKTIAFIAGEWGKDMHPEVFGDSSGVRKYQSASAIYLPNGGEVRACTSGSASKDGGLESHVVADETHLYTLRELREMYATISRNLGKRYDADPWLHQTSTAYRPGEMSVFEETLTLWRKKELPSSVFVNHREAKGRIDIADTEHTLKQLNYVYGAAAEWIDMDRKIRDMRDPRICPDEATAARYFLNRPMSTVDAWIAKDVHERQTKVREVMPGEAITLGFDGSLNDDTTVLRGSCMSDGFLFRIGAWPKPEGAAGIGWEVPRADVLATIREAFARYDVVRAYFDPHEWRSDIDALAAEFGDRVVQWATTRDTAMGGALDRLHADLMTGVVWHDDDPLAAEHYGNVFIRRKGSLRLVRKEHPNSARKIDSVVGDALAYEARADAIAAGWGSNTSKLTRVKGRASAY